MDYNSVVVDHVALCTRHPPAHTYAQGDVRMLSLPDSPLPTPQSCFVPICMEYVRTCTYNSCHFVMLQCAIHWSFTVTHWATNSSPKGPSSAVLPTVHVHRAEVGSLSSSTTLITWACTCRCVVVSHDWVLGGACEFVCMCVCLHTLQVRDKTIVWESHCSTEWYCHIR